jgi:hypothetical protein
MSLSRSFSRVFLSIQLRRRSSSAACHIVAAHLRGNTRRAPTRGRHRNRIRRNIEAAEQVAGEIHVNYHAFTTAIGVIVKRAIIDASIGGPGNMYAATRGKSHTTSSHCLFVLLKDCQRRHVSQCAGAIARNGDKRSGPTPRVRKLLLDQGYTRLAPLNEAYATAQRIKAASGNPLRRSHPGATRWWTKRALGTARPVRQLTQAERDRIGQRRDDTQGERLCSAHAAEENDGTIGAKKKDSRHRKSLICW